MEQQQQQQQNNNNSNRKNKKDQKKQNNNNRDRTPYFSKPKKCPRENDLVYCKNPQCTMTHSNPKSVSYRVKTVTVQQIKGGLNDKEKQQFDKQQVLYKKCNLIDVDPLKKMKQMCSFYNEQSKTMNIFQFCEFQLVQIEYCLEKSQILSEKTVISYKDKENQYNFSKVINVQNKEMFATIYQQKDNKNNYFLSIYDCKNQKQYTLENFETEDTIQNIQLLSQTSTFYLLLQKSIQGFKFEKSENQVQELNIQDQEDQILIRFGQNLVKDDLVQTCFKIINQKYLYIALWDSNLKKSKLIIFDLQDNTQKEIDSFKYEQILDIYNFQGDKIIIVQKNESQTEISVIKNHQELVDLVIPFVMQSYNIFDIEFQDKKNSNHQHFLISANRKINMYCQQNFVFPVKIEYFNQINSDKSELNLNVEERSRGSNFSNLQILSIQDIQQSSSENLMVLFMKTENEKQCQIQVGKIVQNEL